MSTISRRTVRSPAKIERGGLTPSIAASQREACVVEVNESSPPVLFHAGESMRLERLPVGSRIVYPPPPLSGHADLRAQLILERTIGDDIVGRGGKALHPHHAAHAMRAGDDAHQHPLFGTRSHAFP